LNPDISADHHHDVCSIDEHLPVDSFDTVIFDPPFDTGQADKRYEGFRADAVVAAREALTNVLRPGGRYVELGWNSYGPAAWDGWEREQLHLFQRGPCLPDVIAVVDRHVQQTLGDADD